MRIITGYARGKKLKSPNGMETRPTADRVKESVFNILNSKIYDANVLDLFGGTGSLGLECISRESRNCVFVEKNINSFKILQENIKSIKAENKTKSYNIDAFLFLKKYAGTEEKYDLIFLDPPYFMGLIEKSIAEISRLMLLNENGIIISEHDTKEELPSQIGNIKKYRDVNYGRTTVSFWNIQEV